MGTSELMVILGLALFLAGILIVFLGFLKALSGPQGRGRAVGLILIGPVPVFFSGRGLRWLILAIAIVLSLFLILILISSWPGVWGL